MATITRAIEIRSVDGDFPVAVPCTTVADGPILARVSPRVVGQFDHGKCDGIGPV